MVQFTDEAMVALSPLDEAMQGLVQDSNLARIKKLLVYTCNHVWESDPARLNQFNLQDLVTQLLAIAPTLVDLQNQLNRVVQTINKSAEYAIVARALIQHLKPLYGADRQPPTPEQQTTYAAIARSLTANAQALRIKKLLYAACEQVWVNDSAILDAIDLEHFIQSLHQRCETLNDLETILNAIVQTLNRQADYRLIAATIVVAFAPAFETSTEPETQLLTAPALPLRDVLASSTPCPVLSNQPLPIADATPKPIDPPTPQLLPHQYRSLSDLFDLRLEIVKYANPLRAKTLILLTIHGQDNIDPQQAWTLTKHYELESLLQDLFRVYRDFQTLEATLTPLAKTLPDNHHYRQAAGAILRAIQPFYAGSIKGLSLVPSAETHHQRLEFDDAETQFLLPTLDDDSVEQTCQFLTSARMSLPGLDGAEPMAIAFELNDEDHTMPLDSPNGAS